MHTEGIHSLQVDLVRDIFGSVLYYPEELDRADQEELYIAALEMTALLGKEVAAKFSWYKYRDLLTESPFSAERFLSHILAAFAPSVFYNQRKPVIH